MSISLAELESRGVLVSYKLRRAYGEEAVSFSAAGAVGRMGAAVAIRLGALLPRESQIELFVAWTARVIPLGSEMAWVPEVASLLASPARSGRAEAAPPACVARSGE